MKNLVIKTEQNLLYFLGKYHKGLEIKNPLKDSGNWFVYYNNNTKQNNFFCVKVDKKYLNYLGECFVEEFPIKMDLIFGY